MNLMDFFSHLVCFFFRFFVVELYRISVKIFGVLGFLMFF